MQQTRAISSSLSGDSTCLFDPLQQSSATVLKEDNDDELSEPEQKLKQVLQQYADYMATMDDPENHELLQQDFEYEEKIQALQEVYMDMGYWSDALGIEESKCTLYYEEGTEEYADSIHSQGKLYLRQEDFRQSKALYDEALAFFESSSSVSSQVQVGHVLISLAGWYYFQNQLDVAMEHLHNAEPLLDSNPPLLVKCLDNQGLVYRLWGDYLAALDKYQQALQVVGEEEATRHALIMHLGDMYQAIEEPQQALKVYQDLVQELEQKGASSNATASVKEIEGMQGVLWHNIATIHVDFGDHELALDEFDRAIQLKTESGGANHPEVAKTWNSLGVLHAGALRQLPKARECFQHALMIARINTEDPSTNEDVIHILQNISHIEQQLNR